MEKKISIGGWNNLDQLYRKYIKIPDGYVLNVCKVKVCKADWEKIHQRLIDLYQKENASLPEEKQFSSEHLLTSVNMLLLGYGPSVDNSVKPGVMKILPGALVKEK
jgi:hypothetical protein